ncbi:MAG TPA: SMP-30/gluconolactonase/LRE family protein [Armatimonadota bacterium]
MKLLVTILLGLSCCAVGHAESTWKDIVGDGPKVERIATGFVFTEGPVWSPKGYLLFSDVPAGIIYRWTLKAGATRFRDPSYHSNGLTFDRQARLLACESEGRVSRTEKDGSRKVIADRYEGKNLNSPNDIVVKSGGSIYFTDPTYGLTPPNVPVARAAQLDFRGVYRIAPNGSLALLGREFGQPNGLAFSPDEKRLYVDDSERNNIRVFDVRADGTLSNDRVFATPRERGKEGATDGMKVDTKGNVYCTGPGAVWVYAPSGTLLGKIATPEVPANCAFGDKDRKTLYITARHSVYRVRLRIRGM